MDQPRTSQIRPLSELSVKDADYKRLLTFMRNLVEEPLAGDETTPRIPFTNEWLTAVDSLNTFFDMVPSHGEIVWSDQADLLAMVEMSLQVVGLIALRVERVFIGNDDIGRKTLTKLLNLDYALGHWIDEAIPREVTTLRPMVLQTILAICRSLDAPTANPGTSASLLSDIMEEQLHALEELSQLLPLSKFPITFRPFSVPRINHESDGSFGATLDSIADVPVLAVTIVSALVQTLDIPLPFSIPGFVNSRAADADTVVELLRYHPWAGENDELLAIVGVYLSQCIPRLSPQSLESIANKAATLSVGPVSEMLQGILVEARTHQTPKADNLSESPSWKAQFRVLASELILPDELSWMDEDNGNLDEASIAQAMNDVRIRFERPLKDRSSNARLALADRLTRLPCVLAKCCPQVHRRLSNISLLPFVQTLLARLLDGSLEEADADVRSRVYNAYSAIMAHDAPIYSKQELEQTLGVLIRGLCDKGRTVRLSAGRTLHQMTRSYGTAEGLPVASIFNHLYRITEMHSMRETETLLITVGLIARTSEPDLLEHSVCFLISHLSRQNPLLKSLSYTQFLAVAKHLKRSPYNLVQPSMNMVAPFLVMRMVTQPGLLAETCRLISVNPTDFISTTLPRTLPQVFANSEARVLEKICQEVQMDSTQLFMKYAHDILAHVFLLPSQLATQQGLNFVKGVMNSGRNANSTPIHRIITSCLVPLLAELVVSLGDETGGNLAVDALDKVNKALSEPQASSKSSGSGELLKEHMLGIITSISQMLQELRGKQSVASKRRILRSFGILFTIIGSSISNVAPQIMATFQTMVVIPELAEVTLHSWMQFVTTLGDSDVGPHVGPISATLVSCWPAFSSIAQDSAKQLIRHIVFVLGPRLANNLDEIVDLSSVPELREEADRLGVLRGSSEPPQRLSRILDRAHNANVSVALQSLRELKRFMADEHQDFIRELASGDMFDPLVGQILSTLFSAACRDNEGTEEVHHLAYECIGILGAVDPDRCDIRPSDSRMIMMRNFVDEDESTAFVLHLISDLLVGAYRSTSDINYQGHLGFCIQELLKFCQFTPGLVAATITQSIPLKVRNRWKALPKHVLETVTPLLGGRFTLTLNPTSTPELPIYPKQSTYREWIQLWTVHLISRASGATAQKIFGVFRSAVRNKDVGVARFLLPHLILNILISGREDDREAILFEILAVLRDQDTSDSASSPDKKLLSAQAIFMLLDHLSTWVRVMRQEVNSKKQDTARRARITSVSDEELLQVDSILSSIDQELMAKAALQCKAYARSLMNFEQLVRTTRERSPASPTLHSSYERLHEIYAYLDEPDGMEGVSALILNPSLEHQIRQHESLGQWTSAQSCWELCLQKEPDNLDLHLGLLRCLRNLGHYDTLRTHVKGILTRNPGWQGALAGFQVESAWLVNAWDEVQELVKTSSSQTPSVIMAQVLLAMRTGEPNTLKEALSSGRIILGAPITASGVKGFRHAYDSLLDLHRTYELELISNVVNLKSGIPGSAEQRRQALKQLSRTLEGRLDTVLPTFRARESVLSIRRTAFAIHPELAKFAAEVGKSWLSSSKIARKAGQWQTAYSATLHARQVDDSYAFIESAKLLKATGEPLRALQELENTMRQLGLSEDSTVVNLTLDEEEMKKLKAKAETLRARWMAESDRFEDGHVLRVFTYAANIFPKWEGCNYHLGLYHDNTYKALDEREIPTRGPKLCYYTVKYFIKSLKYGSKHVYQTVPRLLTVWLDMADNEKMVTSDQFPKINELIIRAFQEIPLYKWYIAFPQIVSRVGHQNKDVIKILNPLMISILRTYMPQASWLFASIIHSNNQTRAERGRLLLDKMRSDPKNQRGVSTMIQNCLKMIRELLRICQHPARSETKLSIARHFPALQTLTGCSLIIPLQQSLTASMPPPSAATQVQHHPFPQNSPTFAEFQDDVEVMSSLAKPRKVTLKGSDGLIYSFLAKPKDDLRKDARIMDLNTVVNKLLSGSSDSRRRQLHIRTYAAIPLNDECGLIQWVPNTVCMRPILVKAYHAKKLPPWGGELNEDCAKIKEAKLKDVGKVFQATILARYRPVFHEWLLETFPEPSAWLAGRLTYSRTVAVMSIVGFMVGLGDRHCENILLDTNTGDVVHCDFNCLFEKGKLLETPERVPFRLTQNVVDGLGITGTEGVFRVACELTLRLLREHKDTVMSILDAFIHDPLVEWEDEKRKMTAKERDRKNQVKDSVDLKMLAKNALVPMEKRLKGYYSPKDLHRGPTKEVSVSNLVQLLIQGATDLDNLARMYPGWAPWY
ncbi:serine/threonine-protein kinase M1 [Pleurotus ostreatus]|uniref:non-specific serine/threonine protein kinase n=1 Tax=Pleurotus ostreatus TaxID=5322 RepID=A0A8H6ZZ38_PLEOS|nr:serine/threonine-protein kinase M1 [Pleurotus ostreatus]KAF7432763.1 serine/threonine-protein kinase M1 [Pleurotus ostreatus]